MDIVKCMDNVLCNNKQNILIISIAYAEESNSEVLAHNAI